MTFAHPELTRSGIHVAAAAADEASVRAQLAADPALASREGGPYGWEPLLYLASARHNPRISQEATLGTARALLEHGADPNAGYLWHGLYPPYTAAACVLGSQGVRNVRPGRTHLALDPSRGRTRPHQPYGLVALRRRRAADRGHPCR